MSEYLRLTEFISRKKSDYGHAKANIDNKSGLYQAKREIEEMLRGQKRKTSEK